MYRLQSCEEAYMRYIPTRRDSAGAPRPQAVGRPNPDEEVYIEIYDDEQDYNRYILHSESEPFKSCPYKNPFCLSTMVLIARPQLKKQIIVGHRARYLINLKFLNFKISDSYYGGDEPSMSAAKTTSVLGAISAPTRPGMLALSGPKIFY